MISFQIRKFWFYLKNKILNFSGNLTLQQYLADHILEMEGLEIFFSRTILKICLTFKKHTKICLINKCRKLFQI